MPRIVFTGDSQTVGCVGAMDYAQMLSWEIPLRVFNRSVGGSNTTHLLSETGGGTVTVREGERVIHGDDVAWFAGPYIGQRVRVARQEYVADAIETLDYAGRRCRLHLTEPAREEYHGTDYAFEPGWRVRIAAVEPDYACFMYTVNDARWAPEEFKARLAEIVGRCREAGIRPLFLSGVPFMDAPSGGSHPGQVAVTMQRAQDLLEFCREEGLPYADIYRTLDLLDLQRTSVWADTIHPTDDGSILILHALRTLLKEMGAMANPYYVRGYRAPGGELPEPGAAALIPITTAQPRRDKENRLDQAGHTLEAQRIRDEYGLIAARDGQCLTSSTPLVFQVGVGRGEKLSSIALDVALGVPGEVRVYDWTRRGWITAGPRLAPADCVHEGALWVAVAGEAPTVDYLGVTLEGDVPPWEPPRSDRAILWPAPGQFEWTQEGNLFPNGALAQTDGHAPAGWRRSGADALYLREPVVAVGTGEFTGPKGDQLHCPGARFTQSVRPLDRVVVDADLDGGPNFLVAKVLDDETLSLRRALQGAPQAVAFEVRRASGLRAVPGGCCLEVEQGSHWQTSVPLEKGEYRLGFFYRAFDPGRMSATGRPAARPLVRVAPAESPTAVGSELDCSFVWLRAWVDVTMPEDSDLRVSLTAEGEGAIQYTGFSLHEREGG